MRRIQPDPDQMPEQFREPLAVSRGQRWLQDRGDVGTQMRRVARAEQHDIDPRLVPDKAIGCIWYRAGATLMD